jgi:hypothetical protein
MQRGKNTSMKLRSEEKNRAKDINSWIDYAVQREDQGAWLIAYALTITLIIKILENRFCYNKKQLIRGRK